MMEGNVQRHFRLLGSSRGEAGQACGGMSLRVGNGITRPGFGVGMKADSMEVSRGSAIKDTKYRKKVHVDGAVQWITKNKL